MDATNVQDKTLGDLKAEANEMQEDESKMAQESIAMVKEAENVMSEAKKAEKEFVKSLQKFQSEQEKILKDAQSMLPVQCVKCQTFITSKKDRGCAAQNGSCFSCFTADTHKQTMAAESKVKSSKYDLISTMDLSDYEEWLFDDDMGRRCLARIVAKVKSQGYDYKPWQISIGASAWSKENYNNTSLEDTRYLVERVKISDLIDYIPYSPDSLKTVIDTIKRAEEVRGISTKSESKVPLWAILGGVAGVSTIIPYLMKKR